MLLERTMMPFFPLPLLSFSLSVSFFFLRHKKNRTSSSHLPAKSTTPASPFPNHRRPNLPRLPSYLLHLSLPCAMAGGPLCHGPLPQPQARQGNTSTCAGAGQEEEATKICWWRRLRTGQGDDKAEAVTARHPGVASTGAAAGGEEEDQEMEAEAEAATGEALGLRALWPVERKRTDGEMGGSYRRVGSRGRGSRCAAACGGQSGGEEWQL